jgi:hypothetical protein
MFAGITYSEALRAVLPKHQKNTSYAVSVLDLKKAFKRLKIRVKERKRIKSFMDLGTSFVIIKTDKDLMYHALVWDGETKQFFDPQGYRPLNNNWRISSLKNPAKKHKPHNFYRKNLMYCYELI